VDISHLSFANLVGFATTLLLLLACILLWLSSRSPWMMVASIAQGVVVLCHLVLTMDSAVYARNEALRLGWPIAGITFAIALTGYAWTIFDSARRARAVQGIAP
jgi:hypothetical protein